MDTWDQEKPKRLDLHEFTLIQHRRNYLNFMVTLHFVTVRFCVGGPPCVRKPTFTSVPPDRWFRPRPPSWTWAMVATGMHHLWLGAKQVMWILEYNPNATLKKKEGPCCEGIKLNHCPLIIGRFRDFRAFFQVWHWVNALRFSWQRVVLAPYLWVMDRHPIPTDWFPENLRLDFWKNRPKWQG